MVLDQIDLLPQVRFDIARLLDGAPPVNPKLRVVQGTAAHPGGRLDGWNGWLRERTLGVRVAADPLLEGATP